MNFKKCVSLSIRVYPGPFLQGRTRYDFKQHPGSSLFVIEAPWLLWHLANISQADQIPRRCQQPSGIRIYINLKQTQNNARLLNITEMYIICIHMYIHYTWTYRFISQLISQNHTLNMNDNMMFIQIPNITSVISYDSCCSPKVNKNPGVSTTPEVKATDKFGESKSQAIRWNRCDRHRRNWRAPGKGPKKISKFHNLWIQTNEIWNWFDINVNIIINIRIYILDIIIYYIIYRTRTGDIITAPWYLSGDLLTRQACNVRKISRSFDTFLEAGSKTNSLFPFFITYDTKCAKAINSYSILFKLLHLTTWN